MEHPTNSLQLNVVLFRRVEVTLATTESHSLQAGHRPLTTLAEIEAVERTEDAALEAFWREGHLALVRFDDRVVSSLQWRLLALHDQAVDRCEKRTYLAALETFMVEVQTRLPAQKDKPWWKRLLGG